MIKVIDGELDFNESKSIYSYHRSKKYDMYEVGCVTPAPVQTGKLTTGQVGYTLLNL